MTRFTHHLAVSAATALLSIALLAGAAGPALSAAPTLAQHGPVVA